MRVRGFRLIQRRAGDDESRGTERATTLDRIQIQLVRYGGGGGGGGGGGKELATLPLYTESPAVEQPAAVGKRFETTF